MSGQIIYLNGDWMPLEEAKIPVLDRGFIFGDGVYEVIPVYGRRPFRLEGHLKRLARSLGEIRIDNPFDDAGWTQLITDAIAKNQPDNQSIYVHITRGVAKRDHAFPKGIKPTVMVIVNPLSSPSREQIENGVACITAQDNRWGRCDIKVISLLANCLLRQQSVDAGVAETILFRDGHLTEASSSNVFIVKNGRIVTPPKTHEILPGITLDAAQDFAREAGLPLDVRAVTENEVRNADEVWLSSSTKDVLAVVTIDGKPIGNGPNAGKPGPMFHRMHAVFQQAKAKLQQAPAHV